MAAHLRVIEPRHKNRTVPIRPANAELRPRECLTPAEVEEFIKAAPDGRYGHRDATLILVAYRHGLRTIEICDLEWSQVEFGRAATLHVRRVKNGKPAAHPLRGDEVRALRELQCQFPDSACVFATERGGPFTPDAVNRLVKRIGERAGFAFQVFTPTCSGTPAATRWRTEVTTPAPSKIGWGTAQSSIPSATPSFRR